MNDEYNDKIKETKILHSLLVEEDRTNNILKEEIRRVNKKITDNEVRKRFYNNFFILKREKESIRTGLALLKKHIEVLNEKITQQDKKSKDFLLNLSTFVNQSLN